MRSTSRANPALDSDNITLIANAFNSKRGILEAARRRIDAAESTYNELHPFFKHTRRMTKDGSINLASKPPHSPKKAPILLKTLILWHLPQKYLFLSKTDPCNSRNGSQKPKIDSCKAKSNLWKTKACFCKKK
ncbi:MAG: hypothetical protein LBV17_08340 [Treponema sp.]|nr:hypothetical protein [Treponema sp.]